MERERAGSGSDASSLDSRPGEEVHAPDPDGIGSAAQAGLGADDGTPHGSPMSDFDSQLQLALALSLSITADGEVPATVDDAPADHPAHGAAAAGSSVAAPAEEGSHSSAARVPTAPAQPEPEDEIVGEMEMDQPLEERGGEAAAI